MKKYRLLSPGPTPVPEKVLLKMSEVMIHHRTNEFQKVLREVHSKLKKVFCTENPVVIMASSGTGAMEASIVNFLSKADKALIIRGGKFGERFGEICEKYGVATVNYDVVSGECADPLAVADYLKRDPSIKAVFSTLCETSTGVVNDIKAIGKAVRDTKAILVVDAISGLAADELLQDEWGVDLVVAGSQKGLMLPPGLSFLSVSKKAESLMKASDLPKYYFDITKALKAHGKDDTPWTPAVSLIKGLDLVLDTILSEGMHALIARHARLANITREAMKSLGLEIFSKRPSNAVTAVKVPQNVDGTKLVNKMQDEQALTIAGGQEELKGKIFRVAHLGYMDDYDIISAVAGLEIVLKELGYNLTLGKGVGRAQELLSK
ncbi:MAG: alanine--glyoxylate aminotransferase family protein [Candidatus Omnitrophica bacterium]|nr:alanine--glyoxylate aminotransferase family protein [Candidatus Omnitrophota bacterium]